MHHNLSVLEVNADGADALVVVRTGRVEDRYFPPLLAAQVFLDVRDLIHQECDSMPALVSDYGFKEGTTTVARRWAFAQEIFSNNGRGTESGHFLEHLVLQLATNIRGDSGDRRPLSGETSWDFAAEPDVYYVRFFEVEADLIRRALVLSTEVLARWNYLIDLRPISLSG